MQVVLQTLSITVTSEEILLLKKEMTKNTISTNENCDGVVLEIYLYHKLQ